MKRVVGNTHQKRHGWKGINVRVSLVEQMVMNPPHNMEDWRMYRIEYGGHAEECNVEGVVWLPPLVDADEFEIMLNMFTGGALDKKDMPQV